MAAIAEAVDIRSNTQQVIEHLLTDRMIAQVAAEIETASSDRNSIYSRGSTGLDGTIAAAQGSSMTTSAPPKKEDTNYFTSATTPGGLAEIKAEFLGFT